MTLDVSHQSMHSIEKNNIPECSSHIHDFRNNLGKFLMIASIIAFSKVSYGQKDSYSTHIFDKIDNKCDTLEKNSTLSQSEWEKIHNQCMVERWNAFLPIADKEINRRKNLLISAINNKDNEQTVDSLKNSLLDAMLKKCGAEIEILSREEELKNSK